MLKHYRLRDYRFNLVVSVLVLTIFGIIVIGSAKESVQDKQIIGLILGLIIMAITSLIDYKFILKFAWVIYAFNIVLLLLVRFLGERFSRCQKMVKNSRYTISAFRVYKNISYIVFCLFLS